MFFIINFEDIERHGKKAIKKFWQKKLTVNTSFRNYKIKTLKSYIYDIIFYYKFDFNKILQVFIIILCFIFYLLKTLKKQK